MQKITLPFVETMITQVCNLSCQGCTNYSDIPHTGYLKWHETKHWFNAWAERLNLPDIGVMGGEPMINPEWPEWLQGLRSMFPCSQLRFTTNGLFLHRYPDILDFMDSIGNIVFKITVHVQDDRLENHIQRLITQRDWHTVAEHGITRLRNKHGVRLQINRPAKFVAPFRNSYTDMAPWNSNPDAAFAECIQRTCPLLYKKRIYKCSTTALLADTLERFGRPNWQQWQPYLTTGIGTDDPEDRISAFVSKFGRPESVCGQCPDNFGPVLDHKVTVAFKRA